jgi:hypothetical protein
VNTQTLASVLEQSTPSSLADVQLDSLLSAPLMDEAALAAVADWEANFRSFSSALLSDPAAAATPPTPLTLQLPAPQPRRGELDGSPSPRSPVAVAATSPPLSAWPASSPGVPGPVVRAMSPPTDASAGLSTAPPPTATAAATTPAPATATPTFRQVFWKQRRNAAQLQQPVVPASSGAAEASAEQWMRRIERESLMPSLMPEGGPAPAVGWAGRGVVR